MTPDDTSPTATEAVPSTSTATSTIATSTTTTSTTTTTIAAPTTSSTTPPAGSPTTTTPPTTTAPTTTIPEPPATGPDGAASRIAGRDVDTTVTRADNRLTMIAGSITSVVNGVADDGTVIPLDEQGLLRLRPGDTIAITTTGWKPDSPTEIRAHSTPTRLGTLRTDANGTTTGTVTLPDTIEIGQHRLVIDGITIGDDRATIAIALHIAGPPSLWSGIPIWIPITLAIALALAVPTRWQRGRGTASQS